MAREAAFWGKRILFRQMRVFWNLKDPLRQFCQAVPVLQVILAIRKATSGTASTGVTDLKASPDIAQTKSIKCELEPASAQAFPSMQLLEGKGPHDAIAMTYSNGTSRFCRPFLWRGTVTSMVG